jgi:membrane-anchored protein YejM (alkaline phosphatase superfamily)
MEWLTWLEVFAILLFKLLHGEYMNEYPWICSLIEYNYEIVMMGVCLSMTLVAFDHWR